MTTLVIWIALLVILLFINVQAYFIWKSLCELEERIVTIERYYMK